MIAEIESEWRETGIYCPRCGGMTYTDGAHVPQCGDDACPEVLPLGYIWEWLITLPEYRHELRARWEWSARELDEMPERSV